jgi:hypothetical protein
MHFSVEKIFVMSLWIGFLASLFLFLSSGRSRIRFPKIGIFRTSTAPLAPMFFGMLSTIFGSTGLMFRILFGWSPTAAVFAALICASIGSGTCVRFLSWFFSESAMEMKGALLLGIMARVSLTIPESGIGSIACIVGGKRVSLPARCVTSAAVQKDTSVLIVDFVDRIALVDVL